jgi:hypothetical protein
MAIAFAREATKESRPGRKTTCIGVRTPDNDDLDYYGIVEEIYQLNFLGPKALKPVVFKYHWSILMSREEPMTLG